ncbi:MAG: 4-alpha-glucanotransferase [Verrucomicrobiota bacterium]|nr:4-alpha-glucanotransferase [Verrucomicrobiota bacterium]
MNLSPDQRIAGVLAPLFALRTEDDLGIGDLGGLRQFVDWAAKIGFKLVQLLPINETGADNGPYNAISAMALEPMTLHLAPGSPEDLTREDFDEVMANVDLKRLRSGNVKYKKVRQLKRALLEKAFGRFKSRTDGREQFESFCEKEKSWLNDYVFFRALMEKNGGREAWDHWPQEQQTVSSAREWLKKKRRDVLERFAEREEFFRYVQWVSYSQWIVVKAYAEERGVALMGDIPFGVSYYSADVFSRRQQFDLDWLGGAPPEPYFKDDAFTQKWGQNWGIPLYRWNVMRTDNFEWWRQRISGVGQIFHVFRVDHVLGFYRIYAFPWRPQRNQEFLPLSKEEMLRLTNGREPHFIPRDDSNSENCDANRCEGEEYLRVVLDSAGDTRLVGEDLGTVPPYVRPSLHSLGIAGFKIPQWEVAPDGRVTPGGEYQRLSVTTYATHDHKPIRAMWDDALEGEGEVGEQARGDLEKIAKFADIHSLGAEPDFDRDFYPPAMEALFRSNAWIAIVMITDLLARKDRFNVPGTSANSNWTKRLQMTVARLAASRPVRKRMKLIHSLLEKTGRISATD